MNTSNMFSLNVQDLAKGLIVAVIAAVVTTLANAMNVPGFDFETFNWSTLLSVAVSAGIGYLSKNFLSDSSGKFGGVI